MQAMFNALKKHDVLKENVFPFIYHMKHYPKQRIYALVINQTVQMVETWLLSNMLFDRENMRPPRISIVFT